MLIKKICTNQCALAVVASHESSRLKPECELLIDKHEELSMHDQYRNLIDYAKGLVWAQ